MTVYKFKIDSNTLDIKKMDLKLYVLGPFFCV